MRWLGLILALLVASPASAQQLKYDIAKGGGQWKFTAVWKDGEGTRHKARFTLPAGPIKEDLQEPLFWAFQKLAKVKAKDINTHDYGKGASCKAQVEGGQLSYSCRGKTEEKREAAMATTRRLLEEREAKWLKNHGMKKHQDGSIGVDWAQHVVDYADDLAPVVAGLGGATPDPRDFAAKALSFVQSIPYEKRGKKPDLFRRPLSLLGRNKGDCDSKTVLYLALLHQAYPELGLGVVVIRKHAFAAIAFEAESGDTKVKVDGERWVGVEPVGPAQAPIGKIGRKSRRALRFRRYFVTRAT